MIIPSMNGASTRTLLDGTLPVRPFRPDGFVGSLQADGQQVRVAALACYDERVITLSLVGFDTSIGVVLARLWSSTAVPFEPATREVHALALLRTAHLTEGILHPPDLPEMGEQSSVMTVDQEREPAPSSKQQKPPLWVPRYVLGNWDEPGPHRQSFLGHLYALRVLFLHRHMDHPEWSEQWAEALWKRGLASELIIPIAAIGMHAWRLSGDLMSWSTLVGAGVREGWLPWRESQTR
jgi:hypothetical protein